MTPDEIEIMKRALDIASKAGLDCKDAEAQKKKWLQQAEKEWSRERADRKKKAAAGKSFSWSSKNRCD